MKTTPSWLPSLFAAFAAIAASSHAAAPVLASPAKSPDKPRPAGFIARLDADGDGKVSRQEFDGPPDQFAEFDRDRDGAIAPAEAPKGPPPRRGGAERFVERLDRNGDGKVSRAEFDGPEEHFDDLDRNGDGSIDRAEAPSKPPCPPPPRRRRDGENER